MNNKGISICVTSAKGGVGKTFSILNLAGIYEILEKKVLIIDFDLSCGGVATSLNVNVQKSVYNLVDDVNNNRFKDFRNYVSHYDEFIDVLASPKDPRQANRIDPKYVELIIDKAVFNYDVVLIDTSHVLNDFNILTMDLVDKLLFMITNDPICLRNSRSLLTILNDIDFTRYKVILNESVDPFRKYFGLYDIKSLIKANVDYVISKDFYIKNVDSFIMNAKVVTLDSKAPTVFAKDYMTMMQIATDMLNLEVDK